MFTLIEKLFFVIANLSIVYACYLVVRFIGIIGVEWIGFYLLQLKVYLYLPTALKNRIQNIKPCCFSSNSQFVLQHAIKNNHLECLKKAYKNGCEWNSDVCNALGLLNHKECLLYAHENDCDWEFCTCDEIYSDVKTCVENGLDLIKDSLDFLKDRQDPDICDKLAVENNKSCLLFAHINGQDWDFCTCDEVNGDKRQCVENGLYKIHVLPTLVA